MEKARHPKPDPGIRDDDLSEKLQGPMGVRGKSLHPFADRPPDLALESLDAVREFLAMRESLTRRLIKRELCGQG